MKSLLLFLAGLALGATLVLALQSRWTIYPLRAADGHRALVIRLDRWTGHYDSSLEYGL